MVKTDGRALFDPSWNTDQGVQHSRECSGGKLLRVVKANVIFLDFLILEKKIIVFVKIKIYIFFFIWIIRYKEWQRWDPKYWVHHHPTVFFLKKRDSLRRSVTAGTRKMVNYAWVGWSQGKLWWRFEGVLTCKSMLKLGYRGERPIEPSSSWFPPKFPSG